MGPTHYYGAHSWKQPHQLSTSKFTTKPRMKSTITSRNISVTTIQSKNSARRNSWPEQMRTNSIRQQKAQRARMQPLAQTGKTHLPKTSIEALKMSTTKMSDAKTHARAQKLQRRALVPRVQGHQSYSKVRRMKHKTNRRTRCKRHYGGYPLRMSHPSVSRRWWRAL